jgi:hypothetical protein
MSATGGIWYALLVALAPLPEPKPDVLVLFAADPEYRAARGAESTYEGTLQFHREPGRTEHYRLLSQDGVGKPVVQELYLPKRASELAVHVGQRVRLVGKVTSVEIDGKAREQLWPARLERLVAAGNREAGEGGVFARCFWQPAGARKVGKTTVVYRNGQQLAQALKIEGGTAAASASNEMAQKLGVSEIDWKKQMVVCVAAGLCGPDVTRLTITRVAVKDAQLTVFYKLERGGKDDPAAGGFGYPAETVLVNRIEGPVRFEQEPDPMPPIPKEKTP